MAFFRKFILLSFLLVFFQAKGEAATEVHVAVASNFVQCFGSLSKDFTAKTGISVLASPGSTGRHFAQINAGAPFQVFLSADALHPKMLEDCGLIVPGSRFTYAVGRLVFWYPHAREGLFKYEPLAQLLTNQETKHLAVAHPRLAPYGRAAQQVLTHLGLETKLKNKLVTGQNISQAWQFVASGNAEAGFVALSQTLDANPKNWRLIPDSMHEPITQQAVLLAGHGQDSQREFAERLIEYLKSPEARKIMATFGYENSDEMKK